MPIQSQNPATGQVIKTFPELSEAELEKKVAQAQTTFASWRSVSFRDRAKKMKQAAILLKQNARHYGQLMAQEMGKPIKQGIAESEKCALVCDYYADHAEQMLMPEKVQTDASLSYVRFDPLGIVLAVMPWNFPFWQVFRFAAPALMAGNVGLLKHASNVPQCALAIEEVLQEAGFPKGTFQTLLIGANKVESIIKDPRVKAATLTGSEYAGSQLAMHCGREIKPTVLELGGSDPFIVLADADLDLACQTATMARLQNAGQSCIAAKRFIVMQEIADSFVTKFKKNFEAMKVGDPMDEATEMGPLSSLKARDDVHEIVEKSVAMGAKIITGGKHFAGPGAFYPPTILTDLRPGMPAYSEEIFGPVASVIVVSSEKEAIEIANGTSFGLGASLWTRDLKKAESLVPQIEAGAVFVNGMVKSDPRLPFGGIKRSGYGRELSHYGLKEFVNVKSVWIR